MNLNSKNRRWIILLIGVVISLMLWRVIFALPEQGVLEVCFLNVGQGDSILINNHNGKQLLIDGGPGAKIKDEIGDCQPFYDRTIEVVLLTHPHYDHVSGLRWILENYRVDQVYFSGLEYNTNTYQEFEDTTGANSVPMSKIVAGDKLALGDKVRLEILYPQAALKLKSLKNANNTSIVAKLYYADSSFLFTGDIEKDLQEQILKQKGGLLEADVLKVPHQGSSDAACPSFYKRVSPFVSVISVGADNPYGHPDREALNLLKYSSVLRTDKHGTIQIFTDGKNWDIVTEK